MTDERGLDLRSHFWPFPESSDIPKDKLETLRGAFTYSYSFDIRSSGNDLIPSNHVALATQYVNKRPFDAEWEEDVEEHQGRTPLS